MKLTKSYSKRMTKAFSDLSFEHIHEFQEIKECSNNLRVFYKYYLSETINTLRLMGFNSDFTEHVFDLYFDFNEGNYIIRGLNKYKDKIVCHPHIFVNPKYRGYGIMVSILSIYYNRNIEFVFSSLTKEGLSFMKRWYKQNNIKYSFFDVEGNPRRENDKRVFYLGTSLK